MLLQVSEENVINPLEIESMQYVPPYKGAFTSEEYVLITFKSGHSTTILNKTIKDLMEMIQKIPLDNDYNQFMEKRQFAALQTLVEDMATKNKIYLEALKEITNTTRLNDSDNHLADHLKYVASEAIEKGNKKQ